MRPSLTRLLCVLPWLAPALAATPALAAADLRATPVVLATAEVRPAPVALATPDVRTIPLPSPGAALSDDDTALEQAPAALRDPAWERLRTRLAELARRPNDPELATAVAEGWLQLARRHADGRLPGRAEAALQPWWTVVDPPNPVLFERASILQTGHRFEAALRDLDRLLSRPRLETRLRAQAHMTRATVLAVLGRAAEAAADCQALSRLSERALATLCSAQLDGLGPRAPQVAEGLAFRLAHGGLGRDSATRLWGDTLAAEIAARAGRADLAQQAFDAALSEDAQDAYLLGVYADFLLDLRRNGEVRSLLAGHLDADALLLRHAIALRRLADPAAAGEAAELGRRFAAARARGDSTHKREESRFALQVLGDAPRGLALALENWTVQKEPADVRVLAEAAAATGNAEAAGVVRAWLRDTGLVQAGMPAGMNAPRPE